MESQDDQSSLPHGGFNSFARQLPENCINYVLVIIDSHLETRRLLSELELVRKAALQLCSRLTADYIWQRDAFHLQLNTDNGLAYLHGTTDYGDSVEDEWLIVYLLRELTRSRSDLWARVADSDGEFLLIEAAQAVPKWLSPEVDSNRAWIHHGQLRLITLDATKSEKRPLSLKEAVQALRAEPQPTMHSAKIEAEAFYRLGKYPQQITEALHYSRICIPRKLAYLIHKRPATIAPAVEAFYARNPISMKALVSPSTEARFPPEDLATISVKFTKVLYAQLKSQHFSTPASWAALVEAAESRAEQDEASRKQLDRLEMGMKLTSGYEMLATSAGSKDNRTVREFAFLLDDLEADIQEEGVKVLPTDADVSLWPHADRDDDDSWLDINFDDFEDELRGCKGRTTGKKSGFGSASAHADLQKIVSRFEAFLNDETAGIKGAELEDMDQGDDDSDGEDVDSTDEAGDDVNFDEAQFASMMRDILGLSTGDELQKSISQKAEARSDCDLETTDEKDIQELSAQMEAELHEHGALRLDARPHGTKALGSTGEAGTGKLEKSEDSDSEDGVDVDYNLAKNLLESFKSQAGLAGPAGNILGMMGMQLPRDEDDDDREFGNA